MKTAGEAGDYEMKYGYQDKSDPTIIKWRILQMLAKICCEEWSLKHQFGDGLTLIEGSLRAVRYAPVQGGLRTKLTSVFQF